MRTAHLVPDPAGQAAAPRAAAGLRMHARLLILGGLILAYLAQSTIDGFLATAVWPALFGAAPSWLVGQGLPLGSALYLLAMALFAAALAPQPRPARRPAPGLRVVTGSRNADRLLLGGGLLLAAFALLRFALQGEDALVRLAWAGGLLLFVAAQLIDLPWAVMLAGLRSQIRALAWPYWAALALIFVAAWWLRYNHLTTIPDDLHGDMASYGIQARAFLLGGESRLFHEGWANIPLVGFLPAVISMWLFGNNLFGLSMSAVLGGMLCLAGLYALTWRVFERPGLAALVTAVLAINIPHIHFSRLAAYMDPWPFSVWAFFFVVDGLKARRRGSLALAGVLFGFGFQMYYSGRVMLLVLAAFLLYALIWQRRWITGSWAGLAWLLTGFVLALGPSLIYFARNQEAFVERSRAVFLFYPAVMTHLMGKYGVETVPAVVLEQIRRSVMAFNLTIDTSTQFGFRHPMFDALISPLIPLGLAVAIRRWREPGAALLLVWWVLNLAVGSILTGDAPFWPRLVGLTLAGAWFAGLALDVTWRAARSAPLPGLHVTSAAPALPAWLPAAAVGLLIAAAGWQNWLLYSRTVSDNARPQARIGRYLESLPPQVAACDFSAPYALQIRETAFLAWPRPLVDLPESAPAGLIEACPGPPMVWILYADHVSRLATLQERWPAGQVTTHPLPDGRPGFTSYLVEHGTPAHGTLPGSTAGTPDATLAGPAAYNPDGSRFIPEFTFSGDTASTPWAIAVGRVRVSGGRLMVWVGPLPGHDAVYDYLRLTGADGAVYQFEAEDPTWTHGDSYADREGTDGHWWLQSFDSLSRGRALVAQKGEMVPVLQTVVEVPDGEYELVIGSFSGDPANGAFELGVSVGGR